MNTERENTINILLGDRGAGKSTLAADTLIPLYIQKGYSKNVHVFMTKPNRVYDNIKDKVNIHIIANISEVENIIRNTYNGSLFFEDSMTLFGDTLDKQTRNMLINTRMCNVDTFFFYHAWGFICKDLLRLADTFTIFQTHEPVEVRKDFLSPSEMNEIRNGIVGLKQHECFTVVR